MKRGGPSVTSQAVFRREKGTGKLIVLDYSTLKGENESSTEKKIFGWKQEKRNG